MQYGWTSPILQVLKSPDSPVPLKEHEETWLESVYMFGGIAGLPVTIFLVDRVGRKNSMVAAATCSLIGWILIAIADRVEYFYAARFLTGLAGDVAFVSAPMYVAEIADKKIRGFLAGMIYLMMLLGILVIYSVAPFVPIYVSSIVGGVILLTQLCAFPFIPKSPYFLLSKGRREEAFNALRRLRIRDNIDKEFEEIDAAVQRQKSEKGRPQDLILIKSNRKALIIMTVLCAAQHFSSISVILMNLHHILEEANSVYMSPTSSGILFAAMMLISATIADFYVDKFGRKILLTTSSLFTGLSLLVIAVYFSLQNSGVDVSGISWLPIASVMIYAAVFKYGLGMIPIVMTAELFPAKVKAMGMTISDAMYLVFALISIELYQRLSALYYLDVPFYIFSASCLFTAAFSMLYIPETKGKTLEEIQFILKGEPYPHTQTTDEKIEPIEKPGSIEAEFSTTHL